MPQPFFIGFTRFEEFLGAVDDRLDLNLAQITVIARDAHFNAMTATVIASQVKGDHLIYCRMPVSKWLEMHIGTKMQPFSERDQARAERAPRLQQQLMDIARELINRHFNNAVCVAAGAPSFPNDLTLIDGCIDSATYDQDTHSFVLKQYVVTDAALVTERAHA